MGISFGAGSAAALAQLDHQHVRSLLLVVPLWPSMDTHNAFAQADFVYYLSSLPILDRLFQFYIMPHVNMVDALRTLAPTDFNDLVHTSLEFVSGLSREFARASKYSRSGACDMMHLVRTGGSAIYLERETLMSLGDRVSVWYALHDQLAPAFHAEYLKTLLPAAKYFPFNKGHLGIFQNLQMFIDEMHLN